MSSSSEYLSFLKEKQKIILNGKRNSFILFIKDFLSMFIQHKNITELQRLKRESPSSL